MNGGLDQFFHNSSGDLAPLALAGLKRLNCLQTYAMLSGLMKLVFGENYPTAREERLNFLTHIDHKFEPDYDKIATNFIQDLHEDFLPQAVNTFEKLYANNPQL